MPTNIDTPEIIPEKRKFHQGAKVRNLSNSQKTPNITKTITIEFVPLSLRVLTVPD